MVQEKGANAISLNGVCELIFFMDSETFSDVAYWFIAFFSHDFILGRGLVFFQLLEVFRHEQVQMQANENLTEQKTEFVSFNF